MLGEWLRTRGFLFYTRFTTETRRHGGILYAYPLRSASSAVNRNVGAGQMEQPKYYPTLEQVKGLAGQGNITPIYRELMADLETPVSAYLKVCRDEPYS